MIMNEDCWLVILDHLFGDFRTLARFMQVSRSTLPLAAQCLYGQLGHPANESTIENLSKTARRRISALLITSCGAQMPIYIAAQQASQPSVSSPPLWPCYQIPHAFNYFDCLRRLPMNVLGRDAQNALLKTICQGQSQPSDIKLPLDSLARLARVVTEIQVNSIQGIEQWTQVADKLSSLSKLTIKIGDTAHDDVKGPLIAFVLRHREVFSGQLSEVTVVEPVELDRVVNCLLEPTKIQLRLRRTNTEKLLEWQNCGAFTRVKEFVIDATYALWMSDPTSLDKLIRACRGLEKVKIINRGRFYSGLVAGPTSALFSWAPQELQDAMNADAQIERQTESCSAVPVLASTGHFSLMPLKEVVATGISRQVFFDIIDGFRNSIEKVDFAFSVIRTTSDHLIASHRWNWQLPRMTVLKLAKISIPLSIIESCPVLEELFLNYVYLLNPNASQEADVRYWQLPRTLRVLCLLYGTAIHSLDLTSIGKLRQLEELQLSHDKDGVGSRLDHIEMLTWTLPNLKTLTLRDGALELWNRPLLRAAPNIQSFSSPKNSIFDCPWWFESAEASYGAEAFHINNQVEDETGAQMTQLEERQSTRWNAHQTKVQTLVYSIQEWTNVQLDRFSLLLDATTTLGEIVNFPRLCHVVFQSRMIRLEDVSFDRILKSLMTRPRMRRIVSRCWSPSTRFANDELQIVDSGDVKRFAANLDLADPYNHRRRIEPLVEVNDNFVDESGYCLLIGSKECYRLKSRSP